MKHFNFNHITSLNKFQRHINRPLSLNVSKNSFKLSSPLFPNQVQFGKMIMKHFMDLKKFLVLAIAPTQSGKTGSMISTIMFMTKQPRINLPLDNIFVITGLSSKAWVEQTQERFPNELKQNIYHRNTLHNFVEKAKNKKNILIMVDETQYACLSNQAIHKAFNDIGLMDLNYIQKYNVKILLVSATPDGCVYDLHKWDKQYYAIQYMDVPSSYISIQNLLENKQVKEYKDLCGYDKITGKVNEEVYDNINELSAYLDDEQPKVHIIRTHTSLLHRITIQNFKHVFKSKNYLFLSETKINMDRVLSRKPSKHTFIFIKEKLRCAQTIPKQYLGILYERFTSIPNDSTIIQGLAGRLTGYHTNKTAIIFTNIESIHKYIDLLKNKFETKSNSLDKEKQEKIMKQNNVSKEQIDKLNTLNQEFTFWISNSTKKKMPITKGTFLKNEFIQDDEDIDIDNSYKQNKASK